jgi:hypothetical protein
MRARASILVAVLAAGGAPPAVAQPVATFARVIDSHGLTIGPVADFYFPIVPLDVNGVVVPAMFFRDYATTSFNRPVYFTGSNCTGDSFTPLPLESGSVYQPSAIVGPNNAIYTGARVADQPLVYVSLLAPGLTGCQNQAGSFPAGLVPVQLAGELSPPYQAPFSIVPDAAGAAPAVQSWGVATLILLLAGSGLLFLRTMRGAA